MNVPVRVPADPPTRRSASGPANRIRSAPPGTASASTSRSSPEHATGVELCLFDSADATRSRSASVCPSRPTGLARLPARRRGRASSTATASTARTSPRPGHRFNPEQARPRPVRQGDRRGTVAWDDALFGYTLGSPDDDLSFDDARQRRVRAAGGGRRHGLHLGRRPRRRGRRGTRRSSTSCTSRASRSGIPSVPESTARHLRRRSPPSRSSSTCRTWASPPSSCCRSITTRDDRHLVERGLANYWGYNTLGYFAPNAALRASSRRRPAAVREFKTMVRALHAAGIEVILDVVYNHTAEGNQMGPTLSLRGHRQRVLLPALAGRPALLHGLHRLRQHAEHAEPAGAAAHHGQPAVLGARRCTSTASASTWPARSPASCTRSTSSARSSTSSTRTRCSRR